jgi:hypothetical protein
MFKKPMLHDCSNEVYVQVLGETVTVKFIDNNLSLADEMSEDEYKLFASEEIPLGMCDSSHNTIYICKNALITKEDVGKISSVKTKPNQCESCKQESEDEQEIFTVETSKKDLKITVLHELTHFVMSSMSRDELSANEELVELIAIIMYNIFESGKSYQTLCKYIDEM